MASKLTRKLFMGGGTNFIHTNIEKKVMYFRLKHVLQTLLCKKGIREGKVLKRAKLGQNVFY